MKSFHLKDDHIFRMTDDTGIFQHAKYSVPDPEKGYTTDDNARALIMAVMLYSKYRCSKYEKLIYRYASFILNAINQKGKFKNFMDYNRVFVEEEGSEDCFGRSIWALAFAACNNYVPEDVKHTCIYLLKRSVENCFSLISPRAKAYAIMGLSHDDTNKYDKVINHLAASLHDQYKEFKDDGWDWFEDVMTYSNAVLPCSMFAASRVLNSNDYLGTAIESLEHLEKYTLSNGIFKPIGCKGWLSKGGKPAEYDEQPVEACETVLCYLEAYKATRDKKYIQKAKDCFGWYYGKNIKGINMIDKRSGGCYDGITENGVNMNQGSESLISYVIARLAVEEYMGFGSKVLAFLRTMI